MAGNRAVFEEAMKRAAEHAWNQHWDLALADYERAAEEFPDDMAARGNLALAYFRLGQWERALMHYTWMLERAPENAFIMDRLIEVCLKLGRYSDAKAMQVRLNALNQKARPSPSPAPATMELSASFVPRPPEAPAPRDQAPAPQAPAPQATAPEPDRPAADIDELVALAMAYEESGKLDDAISHYEQAIAAGLERTDAYYSLGLLYQQQGHHEKALVSFARCLDDADYAMSATFASGVSQRALGHRENGARMLSLAISLIDPNTIGPAETPELIRIYRTTIEALADVGNFLQASNLASSLADFLVTFDGYDATVAEYRALSQQLQEKLTAALAASAAPPVKSSPTSGRESTAPAAPRSSLAPPPEPTPVPTPPPAQPAPAVVEMAAPLPSAAVPMEASLSARPAPSPVEPAPPKPSPSAPVEAVRPSAAQPRAQAESRPDSPQSRGADEASSAAAERLSKTPAHRTKPPTGSLPSRRPATAPLPDIETSERLATSYRRVATATLGGATERRPTGPTPGDQSVASRPLGLPADRLAQPAAPTRRHRLHAISGPLVGLDRQPQAIQDLAAEADANARSGRLLGAIDACYAMIGLAPDFLPAHLRLAELHARRGEMGTALNIVQTATQVLTCRNAPAVERAPVLRLAVRLRPTDEAALAAYTEAAHQAGQAGAAAPLIRRLVQRLVNRSATSRALTEAERLAEARPDDVGAQLHFADTLLVLGQPDRALEVYRQVLPTAPEHLGAIAGANLAFALLDDDALWWSSLESLVAIGRGAKAKARLPLRLYRRLASSLTGARAGAVPPSVAPRVQAAAGLLALTVGRADIAQQWLTPLLTRTELEPRLRAVILHAAALAAAALNDLKAEVEHRRATLDLAAADSELAQSLAALNLFDHPLTLSHLGLALADLLARQGAHAEAIQVLDPLRQRAPGDEAILNRLSELRLKAGQLGQALAALDELASHHRDAGHLEEMATVLDRMSQLAPNNIAVKTKLIDAYLQRGFVEQARRELELRAQLQASSGKMADAVASLQQAADICWTLGRATDAFALCEQMITLQPSNIDVRQYLITLYLQLGLVDRAVEHTWALANMHIAADNHSDAIAALHQIIGLVPDDSKAHHRLGEALAAIGEYAQAERVYRRLARQHPDDAVARARQVAMAALVDDRSLETARATTGELPAPDHPAP